MRRHLYNASWFALIAGLLEGSILLLQRDLLGRFIWTNTEVIWMAPLSYLAFFLPIGVVFSLLATKWDGPKLRRLAVFSFATITFESLIAVAFGEGLHAVARLLLAAGLGWQLSQFVNARADSVHELIKRSLPVLATLVLACGVGLAGWRAVTERRTIASLPAAQPNAPNVLVIVLDAVRASIMSVYGYDQPTTPQIDRYARDGVVFERAIAPTSWTLPSHATMFTGRWPHELGVGWMRPLDDRFPTIANAFQQRGYVTGGFTGNFFYATREAGLHHGFGRWVDRLLTPRQIMLGSMPGQRFDAWLGGQRIAERRNDRRGPHELRELFERWKSKRGDRPFFAFINFFAAHRPYMSTPEFRDRFGVKQIDRYAAAVATIDAEVGRLLDELKRMGELDRTIVIVTSDHGEQFGENGRRGHGKDLHMPALHVPLIMIAANRVPAGTRVKRTVSLRDLPATILDLAGAGPSAFPGTSLSHLWRPGNSTEPSVGFSALRPVTDDLSREPEGGPGIYSLVDDRLHYIRFADGLEKLYEYRTDPVEAVDIVEDPAEADALARFRTMLARLVPELGRPGASPSNHQ